MSKKYILESDIEIPFDKNIKYITIDLQECDKNKLYLFDESAVELQGAEKAWKFCRFLREECDYRKVYGMGLTDIMDMSYQNARAKYEAWLKDESEEAFAEKVFYEFINEGQNNASKYGFRLGETMKFTPDQIVDIMRKTGLLKKMEEQDDRQRKSHC